VIRQDASAALTGDGHPWRQSATERTSPDHSGLGRLIWISRTRRTRTTHRHRREVARGVCCCWCEPAPVVPARYSSLSELAGLVVAGRLRDDDVDAVKGIDEGDSGHQGGELVLVVVLGGIRPSLVGDTTGRVGDAGALLC
jgi:hypothetical protein